MSHFFGIFLNSILIARSFSQYRINLLSLKEFQISSIDSLKKEISDCLHNKQCALFMRSPCPKHEGIQCSIVRMHYSFMHIFYIYEIVTDKMPLRKWFDKHHAGNFFWEKHIILKEEWMEHYLPKKIKLSPTLIVFETSHF